MLDSDSLAQIQEIVTAATTAIPQEIGDQGRALRQDIAGVEGRLRQEIAGTADTLRQEIAEQGQQIRQELRQDIAAVEGRLRQEIAGTADTLRQDVAETRRHMGVLTEWVRHDLQLVAEAVQLQGERIADLRREIHAQAQEMRALLGLSSPA
jgi:hypothetical protein